MVYTDGIHLVADNLEELHKFARRIGLRKEWFQDKKIPHYDIWGSKLKKAIESGARIVGWKEIVLKGKYNNA
ncbi:hypothetical protein ES705_21969 [subsurface metagenome]